MIPITDNTIKAVAALIYNYAYDQDAGTGWMASDEHSAPGGEDCWLEWSACLLQALQEQPEATDEQILALAKQHVDTGKAGLLWDTIWMHQTEEGDEYSTITHETDVVMPIVRHFLEKPANYIEAEFLEGDPAWLAYWESPA